MKKTFGDLFFEYGDEVKDITFVQALTLLFQQIKLILENQLFLAEDHINEILDKLLDSLPKYMKGFICQTQLLNLHIQKLSIRLPSPVYYRATPNPIWLLQPRLLQINT